MRVEVPTTEVFTSPERVNDPGCPTVPLAVRVSPVPSTISSQKAPGSVKVSPWVRVMGLEPERVRVGAVVSTTVMVLVAWVELLLISILVYVRV